MVFFLVIEISLRLLNFHPAHFGEKELIPRVKPDSFFEPDSNFGFRVRNGQYHFYIKGSYVFSSNNGTMNRTIGLKKILNSEKSSRVHLYGCSYTYGFSVSDTTNYPYFLQSKLSNSIVVNQAVPGYGLTQMYLRLQQDLKSDLTMPSVVVFNYASFHDERSVLKREWINRFGWALQHSTGNTNFVYPFADIDDETGRLQIKYLPYADWPQDFPLRSISALIHLLNSTFNSLIDRSKNARHQKAMVSLVKDIDRLCKQNGIHLFFYCMTEPPDYIRKVLIENNIRFSTTSIDISKPGYNCSPLDPLHPNQRAHEVYAHEVFQMISSGNLVDWK